MHVFSFMLFHLQSDIQFGVLCEIQPTIIFLLYYLLYVLYSYLVQLCKWVSENTPYLHLFLKIMKFYITLYLKKEH